MTVEIAELTAVGPLAVVVVSFGAPELLRNNLATMDLPCPPENVVVIDNFRSVGDQSANAETAAAQGWTFLPMDANLGFGAGVNAGARRAFASGAEYLLVLNPDARMSAADIDLLWSVVAADPMALAGPRIVRSDGRLWSAGMITDRCTGDVRPLPPGRALSDIGPDGWLSGACFLVSRYLWERVGGFDEDYFLYWEDVDLSRRCVDAGGRLVVVDGAEAVHDAGGTQGHSGSRAKSPTYYYYNCRNRLMYATKHLGAEERRSWFRTTPAASWRILMRGGRRQLIERPTVAVRALVGTLAGLRIRVGRSDGPTVLLSFPSSNRDPLTSQLSSELSRSLPVRHFSWSFALTGRYDVFNVHWPDHLTKNQRSALTTAARRALYLALMVRIRFGRAVLVRTLHNLTPHERRRGVEKMLLDLTDRWTDAYVTMQPGSPLPSTAPSTTIPQGHYRSLYDGVGRPAVTPGRLLFFGIIRGYKGIPALIDAFSHTADPNLTLRIVGRPYESKDADAVEGGIGGDGRISAELGWVEHEDLAREIAASELVVLPYLEMHNSGTVLVALSLDRPILVPWHPHTKALADEVGPGWVHTYEPPLTSDDLLAAVRAVRDNPPQGRPDLSGREWGDIAAGYVSTLQETVTRRRKKRR